MAKYKKLEQKINTNTLSKAGKKYYSDHLVNTGAGKGDAPRSCFSTRYRDNYNQIFRKNKKVEK